MSYRFKAIFASLTLVSIMIFSFNNCADQGLPEFANQSSTQNKNSKCTELQGTLILDTCQINAPTVASANSGSFRLFGTETARAFPEFSSPSYNGGFVVPTDGQVNADQYCKSHFGAASVAYARTEGLELEDESSGATWGPVSQSWEFWRTGSAGAGPVAITIQTVDCSL